MTSEVVGYKLISVADGIEHGSWGGVLGQCPGIPNPVKLPSGLAQVGAPSLNVEYVDYDEKTYRLVEWLMDTPPAPPPTLQPYQFFAMLELSGKKAALDAFIAALPPPQNVIAKAKLDHTLEFHRDNDLVLAAQAALKLSDTELDALWLQAAAIV